MSISIVITTFTLKQHTKTSLFLWMAKSNSMGQAELLHSSFIGGNTQ